MTMPSAGAGEQNPYGSFPEADSTAAEGQVWGQPAPTTGARRFRWIAILVGYGSDYLLTEMLDRIFWFSLGIYMMNHGGSGPGENGTLAIISFLGSSSSVVGGFVCGFVAKHSEVKHGVVQMLFGFTIFLLQVWRAGGWGLPPWYYAVTIPAVSIATVSGAWLARERRLRRERVEHA